MNVAVKPPKHAAPGQYLGFALQPVRLCFHLLTCEPGAKVSLGEGSAASAVLAALSPRALLCLRRVRVRSPPADTTTATANAIQSSVIATA